MWPVAAWFLDAESYLAWQLATEESNQAALTCSELAEQAELSPGEAQQEVERRATPIAWWQVFRGLKAAAMLKRNQGIDHGNL